MATVLPDRFGASKLTSSSSREWAAGSGWDKTPPAPELPDDVVARTRELYVEAYERIVSEPFSAWLERTAP